MSGFYILMDALFYPLPADHLLFRLLCPILVNPAQTKEKYYHQNATKGCQHSDIEKFLRIK